MPLELSLVAMEVPGSFDADAIRYEKIKALKSIAPIRAERVVRGQYTSGTVAGKRTKGYLEEDGIAGTSQTETFVAMELFVDSWRWQGVPFYIRTGKRMPKRVTEISIQFKRAPFLLFRQTSVETLTPNRLVLLLQPDEGISLSFGAKIPGPLVRMGNASTRKKDLWLLMKIADPAP